MYGLLVAQNPNSQAYRTTKSRESCQIGNMRFLKITPDGGLVLTEQMHKPNIPPYATLSHTWGDDRDEVSIHDIRRGDYHTKAGYRKIQFCRQQAIRDKISHFWIDTCCLDQDNKEELDRAVNRMWRWYRESTKCYVFLSDVKSTAGTLREDFWESAKRSRWFTRGWTLQELLNAPRKVYFFDCNGMLLGNRKEPSMYYWLSDVTGISSRAFEGDHMASFGVRERFKWASCRVTKREEDMAYCLLGVFNIRIP